MKTDKAMPNKVATTLVSAADVREEKDHKNARSGAFAAIHSAASGLFAAGVIDKTTMREFDADCLVAPDITAI